MVTTPDPKHPGVQLLGGDMQMWSDFDPGRMSDDLTVLPRPHKLWQLLLQPTLSRATGRTLLLGAEAAKCVGLLPADAQADVIVRSRTDAGVVVAARPGTRVWAGSYTRFDSTDPYDLVVSLDTVETLVTPDDEPTTSQELVRRAFQWAADGGSLCLRIPNRLGIDTLLAEHAPVGEEWGATDPGLTQRELATLANTANTMAVVGRVPRMLVSESVAEDERYAGLLTTATCSALIDELAPDTILRDPMSVVPSIVEAGELMRLAPSWILVRSVDELPSLLIDADHPFGDPKAETVGLEEESREDPEREESGEPDSARPDGIDPDSSWSRWIEADGEGGYTVRAFGRTTGLGPLWRDVDVSAEAQLASAVLEARWREAAASGQLEPLRDQIRLWARWADALDHEQAWFATPDNVAVHPDGSLSLLDASWRWIEGNDPDAAKVLGLRRFAMRMLATGASHPWPANVTLDGVTEALALMAGLRWSENLLERAVRVGERIKLLSTIADESRVEDLVERSLILGRQHQLSLGAAMGREAQQRLLNRLGNEAAEQQLKVEWYERHVRRRDGQLNGLERQLESIEASVPYKIARGITWPGRAAIRGAKGIVKRALPPSAWQRLISFAKKRLH